MMTKAVGENATRSRDARVFFGSRILLLILAILFAPASAAAASARDLAKGNPRPASLQIEIWPEFDRPAAALVILKGEVAAGVPLPAAVSLRIPAASGGPTAVASSATMGGNLANMKYDRKDAGDFITLTFDAPDGVFHVEGYDPPVTTAAARIYSSAWTVRRAFAVSFCCPFTRGFFIRHDSLAPLDAAAAG